MYYGLRYAALRAQRIRWLFVLGHMRSGSSVLVHVLNSNPEILGYGETHMTYVGRRSLVQLYDHVLERFESHGTEPDTAYRYVMDKILWPHIYSKRVLQTVPLNVIVVVRHPEDTLPSILSRDLKNIQTSSEALQYYTNSLDRIAANLHAYDAPYVLVRYEDLTRHTSRALRRMSEYLGLDQRLTERYQTTWATGAPGIGDSSENIHEGKIAPSDSSYDVEVDGDVVARAEDAYLSFLREWRPNGTTT